MLWGIIETQTVIKIAIAVAIGIVIGLERELKQKPAGIKTAVVLTVGSCLLTIVSIHSSMRYAHAYVSPMDPLRLAAQIVSGIGFLGGGVILHRNNDVISGITTAAIVWASGGIGIAIGAGFYAEAILSMLVMIIAVEVIPRVFQKIGPRKLSEKVVKVRLNIKKERQLTDVLKEMKQHGMKIDKVKVKEKENEHQMDCQVRVEKEIYTTEVFYEIKKIDGVVNVEVESLG